MNKILAFCCFLLVFGSIGCQSSENKSNNASNDLISEWIKPKEYNWKLLKNILEIDPSSSLKLSTKYLYFNLPNNQWGIAEDNIANDKDISILFQLFEIKEKEINIVKEQLNGSFLTFDNENVYWKIPVNNDDTIKWNCRVKNDGTFDKCCAYFGNFEIQNEKRNVLFIERKIYNKESNELIERVVEIYQKNKGIYEIDNYASDGVKLLMKYIVSDVGFDKNQTNDIFPLSDNKISNNAPTNNSLTIDENTKKMFIDFWDGVGLRFENHQIKEGMRSWIYEVTAKGNNNTHEEILKSIYNLKTNPALQEKIFHTAFQFCNKEKETLRIMLSNMCGSYSLGNAVADYVYKNYSISF